ncbi:MAG: PIN domain-containing protein [bacterium]
MKDRVFIDTNIYVYSSLEDNLHIEKRNKAVNFIKTIDKTIISNTQVINEFYVILVRNKISDSMIQERVEEIIKNTELILITVESIRLSWKIKEKYKYSYWDSLILASALENGCSCVYTEDMQNGQLIEEKLNIINPFLG